MKNQVIAIATAKKAIKKDAFLAYLESEKPTYKEAVQTLAGVSNGYKENGEFYLSMKDGELVRLSDYVNK